MKRRTIALLSARAWAWLRAVSGDDAYEVYTAGAAPQGVVLTRREFYLDRLGRKYSRVNRCC